MGETTQGGSGRFEGRRWELVHRWLPVGVWTGAIFWGSGPPLSAAHTSRILVPFLRWLVPGVSAEAIDSVQTVVRKGGHVTEYALLCFLVWRALAPGSSGCSSPGRRAAWALALAALYAATDEFHQTFVPGREGSVRDVLIDSAGAAVAAGVLWLATRRRRSAGGAAG